MQYFNATTTTTTKEEASILFRLASPYMQYTVLIIVKADSDLCSLC